MRWTNHYVRVKRPYLNLDVKGGRRCNLFRSDLYHPGNHVRTHFMQLRLDLFLLFTRMME